jgi:hypothetical protein
MSNIKGRGIKLEIAATYAAADAGWAVSNANPGVATKTGHAVVNNDIGYFTGIVGMDQLDGQAVRAKNKTANTFELQGIDTTNMGTQSGTCDFVKVATWVTMSEATAYRFGGGTADKLDATRLIDTKKQEEVVQLPTDSVSVDLFAQGTPSAALQVLINAVQTQSLVTVRITHADGSVRLLRGDPSLPGEDVRVGQLGTGSFEIAVKGTVLQLAA